MTYFDAIENQGSLAKSEPISLAFDSTELLREGFKSGVFEKSFVNGTSDRLLPSVKVDMAAIGAEARMPIFSTANLDDRGRRTAVKAEQDVQNRMTPEERRKLHEDKLKYDEAMERYRRADMIGALPFGYNKPPEKPQSLKQYEKAVHAEIKKQDPKFFSNNFLVDGEFHKPVSQIRYEMSPEERRKWLLDSIQR